MKNIAIYIHWPFCKSKCPYCDFNSHVREKIDQDKWNDAYLKEISNVSEFLKDKNIVSIFMGGGTPSLMPNYIVKNIIVHLKNLSHLDENIEITLEANPTSVEAEKFKEFALAGVNRVSLGIQSLNSKNLKFLGREHSVTEAMKAIKLAKDHFPRYSFDLIYALPNQSLQDWEEELKEALKLADKHLSLYQLTIEKGTPFYSLYQNKKFKMPEEELARDFYLLTQRIMEENNLPAYEISNHAAEGEECRHNLVYWQYDDFLGIGPGAHSRINNKAIHAIYHPENWLNKVLTNESSTQNEITLTKEEIISEILLMGLRINRGINQQNFYNKTGLNFSQALNQKQLDFLLKEKFLEFNDDYLLASEQGRLVLNSLINKLLISIP